MRLHLRRREEKKIASIKNWTLIYGRRKTGKTTLVKSALKYDTYIIIGDVNNAITQSGEIVRIEKALEEVKRTLKNGGIAVIDEFQRLPEIYWSLIASWAPFWYIGSYWLKLRDCQ
ncbi:AAA family ATPase [Saccharolobus islandicus]|uniref:AAA family ATPase n=1 Tax=Saccharolobus islandicus TaxID=43080 RepID=UPI000A98C72E|nr:AAA family ATPase [Sulfolobus islandicus]